METKSQTFCHNANAGPARWYCYDYGRKHTEGKEKLSPLGFCETCEMARGDGELPSFLEIKED